MFSCPAPQLQPKVDAQLLQSSVKNKIGDDFISAFMHAGIPLNKLQHPSIKGLFKKYTAVPGINFSGNAIITILFYLGNIPSGASLKRAAELLDAANNASLSCHLVACRASLMFGGGTWLVPWVH